MLGGLGLDPPSLSGHGVLGGVDQGDALAKTFFGSSATYMDYVQPILHRDPCGDFRLGVRKVRFPVVRG